VGIFSAVDEADADFATYTAEVRAARMTALRN
jgi:hypothetical protein